MQEVQHNALWKDNKFKKVFSKYFLSKFRLDSYLGLGCFFAAVISAVIADASSKEGEKGDYQKHVSI